MLDDGPAGTGDDGMRVPSSGQPTRTSLPGHPVILTRPSEELAAIKRLDEQARRLGRHASGPSVEALFSEERARSYQYGG